VRIRELALAVFLLCAGTAQAFAEAEPTWDDFKAFDRIGTAWAYSAFLQRYPTSKYIDTVRERLARLVAREPPVDLSRTSQGVPAVSAKEAEPPALAEIDLKAVRKPGYREGHFMLRHPQLKRW
jgi:hypothetical protein